MLFTLAPPSLSVCLIFRFSSFFHLHIWKCQKHGPKNWIELVRHVSCQSLGQLVESLRQSVCLSVDELTPHSSLFYRYLSVCVCVWCGVTKHFGPIRADRSTLRPNRWWKPFLTFNVNASLLLLYDASFWDVVRSFVRCCFLDFRHGSFGTARHATFAAQYACFCLLISLLMSSTFNFNVSPTCVH